MPKLTIRGLNQAISGLHADLEELSREQPQAAASLRKVWDQAQGFAASLEKALAARGATLADLTRPAQQGLAWIRWLAQEDHLALHVETLTAAARLAGQASRSQAPVRVRLYPGSSLVRARPMGRTIELTLNQGFAGAPEKVLQALVEAVLVRGNKTDLRGARTYARGAAFQAFLQSFAVAAPSPRSNPQGRFYHLEEIYQRVNQAYFGGQIAMPRMVWSQTRTRRKFGHYDFQDDTLMVSRTLDQPGVPALVLDAVMYHELLHKSLGVKVVNGRRYTHTAEFRAAEKRFKDQDQAEAFLKNLATQLQKRRKRARSRR